MGHAERRRNARASRRWNPFAPKPFGPICEPAA
jgi:hypothetical protein